MGSHGHVDEWHGQRMVAVSTDDGRMDSLAYGVHSGGGDVLVRFQSMWRCRTGRQ